MEDNNFGQATGSACQDTEEINTEVMNTVTGPDGNIQDTPSSDCDMQAAALPSVTTMRKSVNHIFLWLLLYNVISFSAAYLLTCVFWIDDEYLTTIICTVGGTALLYLCTFKKWPFRPFARGPRKMTVKDFFTIFGVFGITQLFTLCVGLFTDAMGVEGTSLDLGPMSVMLFIYAVLLGPAVEELLYRGFMIGNGRTLGKIPSIIISAFAFGLMHGNLSQFVIGFTGGIVLGFTFAEYSIWWALLIHIINNLMGVLPMAVPLEIADFVAIAFYVIIAVAAVYAVIQIIRRWSEVKEWFADTDNHGTAGVTRSVLTSPWFIIYTVFYVGMIVMLMVFPDLAALPITAG